MVQPLPPVMPARLKCRVSPSAEMCTLVPLSLYQKRGRVKVELALVHGKQEFDRREDVKKREAQREIDRAMARRR